MAFDPSAITQVQYSGTPYAQTIGTPNTPTQSARFVPITINWLIPFTASNGQTSIAVPINMTGGNNQGGLLDKILGVKIDNTNSTIPISVWFPDTGDIISCPPQSVYSGPVMTNGLRCFIIAQGLTSGFLPTTKIFLTNFILPPSYDPQVQLSYPQMIGSPNIQRGNLLTPGFSGPALGDQTQQIQLSLVNGAVNFASMFNAPYPNGFVYLTGIQIDLLGIYRGIGGAEVDVFVKDQTTQTDLFKFRYFYIGSTFNSVNLLKLSGFNLRLDATHNWIFTYQVAIANPDQGFVQMVAFYSVNPN